jgi:hypothetical protein
MLASRESKIYLTSVAMPLSACRRRATPIYHGKGSGALIFARKYFTSSRAKYFLV